MKKLIAIITVGLIGIASTFAEVQEIRTVFGTSRALIIYDDVNLNKCYRDFTQAATEASNILNVYEFKNCTFIQISDVPYLKDVVQSYASAMVFLETYPDVCTIYQNIDDKYVAAFVGTVK